MIDSVRLPEKPAPLGIFVSPHRAGPTVTSPHSQVRPAMGNLCILELLGARGFTFAAAAAASAATCAALPRLPRVALNRLTL